MNKKIRERLEIINYLKLKEIAQDKSNGILKKPVFDIERFLINGQVEVESRYFIEKPDKVKVEISY